ncbi:hypothetical protein C0989_000383 [Termitomyces sp. Mn162]|nr:hypothetical protein C0989_000383 [Termitomyces sp. Mn162]
MPMAVPRNFVVHLQSAQHLGSHPLKNFRPEVSANTLDQLRVHEYASLRLFAIAKVIEMIINKQPLPDDPAPSDSPPSYETVNADLAHAKFQNEKQLEPVNVFPWRRHSSATSSPNPTPISKSPTSSATKGNGKETSFWFPFKASKPTREVQATVLGLIRDLVKEQSQNPAASLAILESCAEACSGYDLTLSSILQEKSIEGHTPMYWAIVKRPPDGEEHGKSVPDLLTALISHATPLSPSTIADIRHACLLTSDQLLFQRLRMSPEFSPLSGTDEMLLGATIPPDAITVENVAGDEGAFTANFEVAYFQKRMLISKHVELDFIARGNYPCSILLSSREFDRLSTARMWRLEFLIAESSKRRDAPRQGSWCISLSLLENSPPTWIDSRLLVPEPTLTSSDTLLSAESSPPPISPSLMDRLRSRPAKPKPTISIRLQSPQQLVAPLPGRTKSRHTKDFCSAIIVSLDDSMMGSSLQYT